MERIEQPGLEEAPDLVAQYNPQFLERGADHLVYTIPDHPDIVVKVNITALKEIREWQQEMAVFGQLSPEIKQYSQDFIARENERLAELKEFYGPERVLSQRKYLLQVPVPQELRGDVQAERAWSIVTVQKKSHNIDSPKRGVAIDGVDNIDTKTPEAASASFGSDFHELLRLAEESFEFKEESRSFVEKSFAYTRGTGEILDLRGDDNIFFYPDGD